VSEIILSPQELLFTGVECPDVLILLTEDGRKRAGHHLINMGPEQTLFVVPEFEGLTTRAKTIVLDPSTLGVQLTKADRALATVAMALQRLGLFPVEALADAVDQIQPYDIAKGNLSIIDAVMAEAAAGAS
jgi:hypothetical protein